MRDSGFFKGIFVVAAIIVLGSFILKGTMIGRALQNGETIYTIDVDNSNGTMESYTTTKYSVDPNTKCITFKDEIGTKKTVCNKYTITEY